MRIVFNTARSGLGNNGGSRTIIRCAETLSQMGHDVALLSPVFRYTWHKIFGPTLIRRAPTSKADLVVSASYHDVQAAGRLKAARKLYYIRGLELWKASERQLLQSFRSNRCVVNSEWLCTYLAQCGIQAHVVYQGVDFGDFKDMGGPRRDVVGALWHSKHKTKRHVDAQRLADVYGVEFEFLNKDASGGPKRLNKWYNGLRLWFAPTELEGLHNPPMEAALAGCAVVRTDHPRCGMADYAIDGETALVYPARNIEAAYQCIRRLMGDAKLRQRLSANMVALLHSKIGSRRTNMARLLEVAG